jgi:hypothetical protein
VTSQVENTRRKLVLFLSLFPCPSAWVPLSWVACATFHLLVYHSEILVGPGNLGWPVVNEITPPGVQSHFDIVMITGPWTKHKFLLPSTVESQISKRAGGTRRNCKGKDDLASGVRDTLIMALGAKGVRLASLNPHTLMALQFEPQYVLLKCSCSTSTHDHPDKILRTASTQPRDKVVSPQL